VLVVDDDKHFMRMISKFLTLSGYEVSASFDGVDGLSKAAELKPDLVILDVKMPGKSGLEVIAEMRANHKTKKIPVMFLSVADDEGTIAEGLNSGDDYVVKPFKPLELEARMRKILERARAGDPQTVESSPYERIAVRLGDETHLVPLSDICYMEAAGKYCYAHTRDKRWLVGESIGALESRPGVDRRFLRVHRSYIVNLDEVNKVKRDSGNKTFLVMSDDDATAIPVSESCLPAVRERLGI